MQRRGSLDTQLVRKGLAAPYGVPEVWDGSCRRAAQQRLQLREGHLDWVEVARVGRELEEPGSHRLNSLADAADLVGRQIVHDDRVAGLERWSEHVGHVGAEGLPVHGTVKQPGCGDAAGAQTRRHGGGFPVALRHAHSAAFAP